MKRLGIFGGTFAPVHRGHVESALAFAKSGLIDEMRIIPTGTAPHKSMLHNDDPQNRLDMLKIAFANYRKIGDCDVFIDPYEIYQSGKSYTINTVKHFLPYYDSITLFCGSDMFLTLESWFCGKELLTLCSVAYDSRTDGDMDALELKAAYYNKEYGTQCTALNKKVFEISSTQIRDALAAGKNTDEYLDPEVREYINEHHLYGL